VCVCVHAHMRVCTYAHTIIFNLNGSQSICLIQKGVPCMYNKHLFINKPIKIN